MPGPAQRFESPERQQLALIRLDRQDAGLAPTEAVCVRVPGVVLIGVWELLMCHMPCSASGAVLASFLFCTTLLAIRRHYS